MATVRAWQPQSDGIRFRESSQSLADVLPSLERIIAAFGTNGTGRALDVDRAQVTRWAQGAAISPEMSRRIVALNEVITRALRQFKPSLATIWLLSSEPLLGGARPIDVLAAEGSAPVIRALEGIAQGAFA